MLTTNLTFAGNLAEDPTLQFTSKKGRPAAEFTVLVNRQVQEENGDYTDAEPTRHQCKAYGSIAENVAESYTTGTRVIVTGYIKTEAWEDRETGQKRTKDVVYVEETGPSMKWASARITKNPKRNDPA